LVDNDAVIAPDDASNRRIDLVRPSNLRELGGIPASGGRRVRPGAVYRAGGLHHLERADVETMAELGIGTLVDLRTFGELRTHGRPSACLARERHHLPMIPDVWDLRPLNEGEAFDDYFSERYDEMLEHGRPAIARTLGLLSDPERLPLCYFCAAGKDRTGVMTAVLLRLLEVDDDAIVSDYAVSGAEVEMLLERMGDREQWTSERMVGGAPRLLAAAPGVMRRFLGRLPEAAELAGWFGISDLGLAALRERLLVPSTRG
jgi:protein-tyrosine phosphatase